MKKLVAACCGLAAMLVAFQSVKSANADLSSGVIHKVVRASGELKSTSFHILNCERINGEIKCGSQNVIMQQSPFKCRIMFLSPKEGDQVVYNSERSKQATYIPVGFPYVNMTLNPYGAQMRKDNHHTIFELGFSFFTDLVEHYYTKKPASFSTSVPDKNIFRVTSELPDFKYLKYIVQKNRTVRSLAKEKKISEHLIYEKNQKRRLHKGDVIFIPNYYYKKIEIEIDRESYLPSQIKVYDDQGLFEDYTFSNVKQNPEVDSTTFFQ